MPPIDAYSTDGSTPDNLRSELQGDAAQLKETVQRQGEAQAEKQMQRVTVTAQSASSALQTAADTLRDDSDAPAWMASTVSKAAQQISDMADRMKDKSGKDMAQEASQFARQSPMTFLAASAAVGFAAARFLRAGSEYKQADSQNGYDQANAYSGYEPAQQNDPYGDDVGSFGSGPSLAPMAGVPAPGSTPGQGGEI